MPQEIVTNDQVLDLFLSGDFNTLVLFIFFIIFVFIFSFMTINNRCMAKVNKEWSDSIRELSDVLTRTIEQHSVVSERITESNTNTQQMRIELAKLIVSVDNMSKVTNGLLNRTRKED